MIMKVIDLIAPAGPVSKIQVQKAQQFVEKLGFKARVLLAQKPFFLFSDTDRQRFLFLKKALLSSSSQALWCLRGGYGCQRLMPFLMKMPKPKTFKWFIGYSDTTILHNFFNLKWKWKSLHFPVLVDAPPLSSQAVGNLKKILTGSLKQMVFKNLKLLNKAHLKNKLEKESILTGGNLTLIQTSIGTPWQFSFKNKIVFLEDVGESAYRLDRALWQIKSAGIFKGVKALVLGDFLDSSKKSSQAIKKVLANFAGAVDFPVLAGVPCGHGSKKEALVFGSPARISAKSLVLKVII